MMAPNLQFGREQSRLPRPANLLRVFGSLDQLLRCKPNLSIIAGEAYIMFANNKTLQWLHSKDSADRAKLLAETSKERKAVHLAFKAWQQAIEDIQRSTVDAKI